MKTIFAPPNTNLTDYIHVFLLFTASFIKHVCLISKVQRKIANDSEFKERLRRIRYEFIGKRVEVVDKNVKFECMIRHTFCLGLSVDWLWLRVLPLVSVTSLLFHWLVLRFCFAVLYLESFLLKLAFPFAIITISIWPGNCNPKDCSCLEPLGVRSLCLIGQRHDRVDNLVDRLWKSWKTLGD